MSLKKTICDTSINDKKGKSKILNTNESTHTRISLLADLLGVTRGQILNSIILSFFRDHEEEIKDRITTI